jgi:hypothetical protein
MSLIDINAITLRSIELVGSLDFPAGRTIAGNILTRHQVGQYQFLVLVHILIKMIDLPTLISYVDIFDKRFKEKSNPRRDYYRPNQQIIEKHLIEISLPFVLQDDLIFTGGPNLPEQNIQLISIGDADYIIC